MSIISPSRENTESRLSHFPRALERDRDPMTNCWYSEVMAVLGTCALCRQPSELQDSHLLPRAIYRDLRMPDLPNPNPIIGVPTETGPRQEQVKTPLLCADCEARFNRNGEKWVL